LVRPTYQKSTSRELSAKTSATKESLRISGSVDNIRPVLSHGAPRPRLFPPYQRTDRTNAAPSAPSPRDAGGRHAASPAGPSPTPGIARVTGATASVSIAIARCPGPSCAATGPRSRNGRQGAAAGPGDTGACRGQRRERTDPRAAGVRRGQVGGPGGAGAPERARWVRMACTARGSCTDFSY